MTIRPGAVTAAERAIVFGKAWPIIPPPAATSTRKNVPSVSENRRRHSCFGSWKSSIAFRNVPLEPSHRDPFVLPAPGSPAAPLLPSRGNGLTCRMQSTRRDERPRTMVIRDRASGVSARRDRRPHGRTARDPQAGRPPRRRRAVERRLRPDARRRPRATSRSSRGSTTASPTRRPTSTSARRSTSIQARELDDYSGPVPCPTSGSPTSPSGRWPRRLIPWSEAYLQLCVDGWAAEVTRRYGADAMAEIEWAAWNDQVVPELERMTDEFLPAGIVYDDPNQRCPRTSAADTRVDLHRSVHPAPEPRRSTKPELVTWFLGSHEYLLQCIEAWATQIIVRYGLDEMFDIQYTLWGDTVLPGVKKLKERVPRHHRQPRRGLDEGPADRRHRRCRARRST